MLYRLLRNNKESGPFTTLQLKDMGLKPYDLLWTEGRGAAWQYASEIPELKSFAPVVEEQPFDRFYKRKEALETAQPPAVAAKKIKPRFRISNGQLIMIEAGNMEVANNGMIKETTTARLSKETVATKEKSTAPDWREVYPEWQPQTKEIKTEEPVEVETKYSESLDDLKKRYAEKVLNEKAAKPSSSLSAASVKQNIMAAVALIVLAVGGYIGYTLKQKDAATTEGKPVVERADVVGDNGLVSPQNDDNTTANASAANAAKATSASHINKNDETKKITSPDAGKTAATTVVKNKVNTDQSQSTLPKKEVNTPTAATHLPNNKAIDKTIAAATAKKTEATKTSSNTTVSKPLPQPQFPATSVAKNVSNNVTTSTPSETKPAEKQNAPKNINDYLSVKKLGGNSAGVQNVRLLVNNVSDFPIDLAVIDIQYFDSKGKYQKGETMYVKNIDGGNNVELRVPDSDKSSSIKYKVSLVSSEKKTLYLVAD